MKTNKNKKLYNFTAKQLARRRTRATRNHWRANAPASFRNPFNKVWRAKSRLALSEVRQFLQRSWRGQHWWYYHHFLDVPNNFPPFVKSVNYYYW